MRSAGSLSKEPYKSKKLISLSPIILIKGKDNVSKNLKNNEIPNENLSFTNLNNI